VDVPDVVCRENVIKENNEKRDFPVFLLTLKVILCIIEKMIFLVGRINNMFSWENIEQYANPLIKMVLILVIGNVIIRILMRIINKAFEKSKLDRSFTGFAVKAIKIILHLFVIMSALAAIGVSTTGIVAALSASAVAVAVALKDSLSNVAGGILLLVSPRFLYGDYIKVDNDEGKVIRVDLLHTTVLSADNKQISIPNGVLINSHIINYSKEEKRRVDFRFPIPYEADAEKAKTAVRTTIENHELVLSDPEAPVARVMEYAESAVIIVGRCWCNTDDYWDVYFDLNEQVRVSLANEGIIIPYNQLEVTIKERY